MGRLVHYTSQHSHQIHRVRRMAAGKRILSLETMNPAVRDVQVPILGPVVRRAAELQRGIDQGIRQHFGGLSGFHYGDLQAGGQPPLTFLRQVAALCTHPDLLHSERFPEDAKRRARGILETLDQGSVGSYNPVYISVTLPGKIARFLERRDAGAPAHPESIVVSGGASQAILGALSLVITQGEGLLRTGILLPTPCYPLYTDACALHGAVAVRYLLDEECGWAVDVGDIQRSLYAARKRCDPRVLCIINPGNPTGQVLSRGNMEEIIRLAAREKLLLLADEVYQENVFAPGATFHSFKKVLWEMGPEYSERLQLVSINSISKGIGAECGLRAGYVEFVNVDPAVFRYLYILKSFDVPSTIGVLAMEVLLEPPQPGDPSYHTLQEEKRRRLGDLLERSRLAQEILTRSPGIRCNPPQAALYAFPRIHIPGRAVTAAQDGGLEPDVFFCLRLLEETGIILVDGSSFGQSEGTYHVRISLLRSLEELRIILERIVGFHQKFLQDFS